MLNVAIVFMCVTMLTIQRKVVRCFVCLCVAAICSLFRCKNYEKNWVDFLGVRIGFFGCSNVFSCKQDVFS